MELPGADAAFIKGLPEARLFRELSHSGAHGKGRHGRWG